MRKMNFNRILIDTNSFISWPNPMLDYLLESSLWDDSYKWSNIGFGHEIDILEMKICTLSGALIHSAKKGLEVVGFFINRRTDKQLIQTGYF